MSAASAAKMTEGSWEHFSHDADVGVRGYGATKAIAFENAARAMTAACWDLQSVGRERCVEVSCSAPDDEMLLVDWLNALIFEMATRDMVFGDFEVRIDGGKLDGKAWGAPAGSKRLAAACEPKGATYTALLVAQRPDGSWSAACVVDV